MSDVIDDNLTAKRPAVRELLKDAQTVLISLCARHGYVDGDATKPNRLWEFEEARRVHAAIGQALSGADQEIPFQQRWDEAIAEAKRQWGWKNWTSLGVANYLRHQGFRSEVAIEEAKKICDD